MLPSCSLRFIRSRQEDQLMKEAAQAVEDHGEEPIWVDEGSLEVRRDHVYVLSDFNSQLYKSLAGQCRVVGPLVVLGHIEHGWLLPTSTQPVFSMAMHGVIACFTQAGSKETRERLTHQVKLMGGRVEGDFTKRVTHLIAGQVGSDKYHVARKFNLPVLLPSWVRFCWEEGLAHRSVSATSIMSQYLCLPFTGCTITVTGLEEASRQQVKEACQRNGGNYSGELTKGVCTHLLVGSKTSAKYKFAREWKMWCVSPLWLHHSVAAGYCLPETDYVVEEGEVAKGKGKPTNQRTEPEWALAVEAFKLPDIAEDEFLSSCKLYLCGFTKQQLDKLTAIVRSGGGVRCGTLSGTVTHVVMGTREVKVQEQVQQLGVEVHVVKPQWLLDSCTQGERLAERGYCCEDTERPQDQQKGADSKSLPNPISEPRPPPRRPPGLDIDLEAEDDIMNQYAIDPVPKEAESLHPLGTGVLETCSVSISASFPGEDRERAVQVVRENGGTVVQAMGADYHLGPLNGVHSESEGAGPESGTTVTMIWLQRCISEGRLLDPTSYFLFQPMTTPISSTTLMDCVLAFSQFSDLEREHLIRFSKGLGAVVQDSFARYPDADHLATTHIVLKDSSGKKYTTAVKWGIPAVADSWLFACAVAQEIVPVEPHLLANRPHLPPGSDDDRDRAPLDGVVICFSAKLTSLSSLKNTALSLGAKCPAEMNSSVTHYVYQGKATEAVRAMDVAQAKRSGCLVVSPHWLIQCEEKGSRQPEADYPASYSPSIALKLSRPQFQDDDVPLTSAESAHQAAEELTSDTSEAMRNLHQQLEELKEAPQEQSKRRRSRRLQKQEDEPVPAIPPKSPQTPSKGKGRRRRGRRKEEPLLDSQVSDSQLLQVTYDDPEGRREKAKLLARIERDEEMLAQGIPPKRARMEEVEGDRTDEEAERMEGLDLELPSFSEDKQAANQPPRKGPGASSRSGLSTRRKGNHQLDVENGGGLRAGTPDAPPVVVPIVTTSKSDDVQPLYDERSRVTRTQKPRFLLSSLEQREKIDYGALIHELGGEYIDQDYFTTKCTHIVVGKASRTEKYLGACAAGKWVLHKSYLEECRLARHFVWEEEHEWGAKGEGSALEVAPRRWRLDLANKKDGRRGGGAFIGWKVLVFAEKMKLPGLKRLLEAGGATVISNHTPSGIKGATHAFITLSHFPRDSLSLQDLVSHGVLCLKPEYIADYLSRGQDINTDPFILNEARNLA